MGIMDFFVRKDAQPDLVTLVQPQPSEPEFVRLKIEADIEKQEFKPIDGLPQIPTNDPLAQFTSKTGIVKVELPAVTPGRWGQPQQVIAAVGSHDIGDFRISGLLMNALTTDPAIRGPLDVRCKAISGLTLDFQPSNDSKDAIECADYVRKHFRDWLPSEEQERFMRTRLLMGVSLAQAIWTTVGSGPDKLSVPSVNCWESQWIYWYWDGSHRNFGRWQVITQNGVIEPISGDGNWIWVKNTEKDPQYTGLIRSLSLRYVLRLMALSGLGKYTQRYALAILKLKHPSTMTEEDVANIQTEIESAGSPLVALPQGDTPEASWDLEWENINSSSGYEVFLKTLSEIKAEIALDILGQTLTSDTGSGGGGSHAQAKVHDQVRMDLRTSDATMEGMIWREQLFKPFAARNFGSADNAPLMIYEVEPPADLNQKGQALMNLGKFLATPGLDLSNVDMDALYDEFGLPLTNQDSDDKSPNSNKKTKPPAPPVIAAPVAESQEGTQE